MSDAFGLPPLDDRDGSGPPAGAGPRPVVLRARRYALAVVALALVGAIGTGTAYVRGRGDPPHAVAVVAGGTSSTSDTTTSATPTPTPDPPRTSRPVPAITPLPPEVAAVVPGWTAVEAREFVAFDVPPDWTVEKGDLIMGFEYHDSSDARLVLMHNVASYRDGVCAGQPASSRARAGFVVPADLGPHEAAPELSERWASVAGLDQGGREAVLSRTQTVTTTVANGTILATESTTLVRFPTPKPCQAGAMAFTAVSFEIRGEVVVFMVYTDEEVADSLAPEVVTKVIASLRPIA
ncbi:MAG: hypothetical protein ABI890_03085 [Lapillicoccus sp.]